jgi:hypothetical protein
MSEDLIIGEPDGSEEFDEYEIEENGLIEYVQAAYFALSAVEDIDVEILPTEQNKRRVKRIKRQSIRIIDFCINELYSNLFDEEEN